MPDQRFKERLNRLIDQNVPPSTEIASDPVLSVQPNCLSRFSWAGTFKGFMLSLVIGLAFANIQTISDMAPQSIKDGPVPGIFGAPVAVVSILWTIITPIWFVCAVIKGAMSGWAVSLAGFPLGLFAGLAVWLGIF